MSITLTSPNGEFSRNYLSYEDMAEKLENMDGMPDHLALDGRITGVFVRMQGQPTNKKVAVLNETLAKAGFKIQEQEND